MTASRSTLMIRSLAPILGLFVLLQLALWALGAQPGSRANVWWWTALSTLAADRGFFNVWTPYPPLFTAGHYALVKAFGAESELLANYFFAGDPSTQAVAAYEQTFATMKIVWIVFNAVFLAVQAALIYRLAQWRRSRRESLVAACAFILFNLSWRSQIVIGLGCDQFDYFPSSFFLLSLLLLAEGHARGSALATGIGVMIKIYPGLLVPLAWANLRSARRALGYTAAVIAFCLLVAAPFLYVNPEIFLATYQSTGSRPGWEAPWNYPEKAFPHMPSPGDMAGQFDVPIPEVVLFLEGGNNLAGRLAEENEDHLVLEFGNGEQQRVEKTDIRFVRWMRAVELKHRVLMILTLVALLALTWIFREALRTREGLLRGALLFVLVLLFFSKGISSYFLLWFFPFLFILYRPGPACVMFSVFLLVGNLELIGDTADLPYYWPSIFLRQALILGLAIEQMRKMRRIRDA